MHLGQKHITLDTGVHTTGPKAKILCFGPLSLLVEMLIWSYLEGSDKSPNRTNRNRPLKVALRSAGFGADPEVGPDPGRGHVVQYDDAPISTATIAKLSS